MDISILDNEFFLYNYDYCYLESMHWLFNSKIIPAENIITGLSYGLDGIECSCFDRPTLSFCMHSQDVFYDTHHIVNILKNDNNHIIKNCLFAFGYYSFHYDLSKTMFKDRCVNVYYPLFKTTHNLYVENIENRISINNLSDPDFIKGYHAFFKENPYYFNNKIVRDTLDNAVVAKGGWKNITDEERLQFAKNRAIIQNKHIHHIETLKENVALFYKICKILTQCNIKIHVIIMPFSQEYAVFINSEYKKMIYGILDEMPFEINFIDFNDEHIMNTCDFMDQDHLTLDGAKKISKVINSLLL